MPQGVEQNNLFNLEQEAAVSEAVMPKGVGQGNNLFNLEQETAVVLGGTGVLGGAMADALAAAGARVAIVGRSEERGKERVRAIEAAGGKAIFQSADAMDPASLTRARDAILAQWGSVSVLVN